jgi:hypothetical protein
VPKSIRGVLREFKHGQLHSGSSTGPKVKSRPQAIAIALSKQRAKKPKPPSLLALSQGHPHKNLGKFLHPKKAR